jgi:hypothetical protein
MGKGKQNAKDRSKAIKAFCLWCMNNQVGEIRQCPSSSCALFAFQKRGLVKAISTPYFTENNRMEAVL